MAVQTRKSASGSTAGEKIGRIARLYWKKSLTSIMRSRALEMPKSLPDLPMRLRPWFLLFTALIMVVLALLGFTSIANGIVNDKLLHFVCLAVATASFYFIFDVEEDARRIWFWRWSGVIITLITCFFFGGIVSEIVQSFLPNKTFDFWDIASNLFGSSVGLYVAFHAEKYYRARREISRLYQPLYAEGDDDEEDSDLGPELRLPFLSSQSHSSSAPKDHANPAPKPVHSAPGNGMYGNVWDTNVRMFDIGEEDSDEELANPRGKTRT